MAIKSKKYRPADSETAQAPFQSFSAMHEAHARPMPSKSWRRVPVVGWVSFILAFFLLATAAGSVFGVFLFSGRENLTFQQTYEDSQTSRFSDTNSYHVAVAQVMQKLFDLTAERIYYNSKLYNDYQGAENQGLFSNIQIAGNVQDPNAALEAEKEKIAKAHNILLPSDAAKQNFLQSNGLPLGTDTSGGLVASISSGSTVDNTADYRDFAEGLDLGINQERDIYYRITDNGKTFNENTTNALDSNNLPAGCDLWVQAEQLGVNGNLDVSVTGSQYGKPLSKEHLQFYEDRIRRVFSRETNIHRIVTVAVRSNPVLPTLGHYVYYIDFLHAVVNTGRLCGILGVLCLVMACVFAPGKVAGDRFWARVTGAVPIEVKIPLLLVFCALGMAALPAVESIFYANISAVVTGAAMCYYYILVAYFFINDLWNFTFDKRSIIRNVWANGKNRKRTKLDQTPLQQFLLRKFRPVSRTIGVLACVAGIVFAIYSASVSPDLTLLAIAGVVVVLTLLRWYAKRLDFIGAQMAKIAYQLQLIRRGETPPPIEVGGCEALTQAGKDLNAIQEGIENAVNDRMKSERLKVELVTNVSHDLKTPLTSIISYVDLLQQEDLPPVAKDYVNILAQKSSRLKNMVLDVFDVSKAATGNLPIVPKVLDLAKLLRQTLADMDAQIAAAPVEVRGQIPLNPVWVYTDGDRMYRVFQNLIQNALQYSLEQSRVYVRLVVEGDHAVTTIRNLSKYEIGDVDALLERFVRGDKNRTTSGSGLGLSIAQTFTYACGGTFRIFSQADLFTAVVTMPMTKDIPPQEAAPSLSAEIPDGQHWEDLSRAASAAAHAENADM